MEFSKCPLCQRENTKSIKSWKYGNVSVKRFQCECGKPYNYYTTDKKQWTIPKTKKLN